MSTSGSVSSKEAATAAANASPKPRRESQVSVPLHAVRDLILQLSCCIGQLCQDFLSQVPPDPTPESRAIRSSTVDQVVVDLSQSKTISISMAKILTALAEMATVLDLDLLQSIYKKIALNARKYPVELSKGKAGKYTEYSSVTGISREQGQSTLLEEDEENPAIETPEKKNLDNNNDQSNGHKNIKNLANALPELTTFIRSFAEDRDWFRYHTPRNLLLALTGEQGELAELFQWKGDGDHLEMTLNELDKVSQEVADVSIYLIRLAEVCNVNVKNQMEELLETI